MKDKRSAQDSLLSYFDELLGDLTPKPAPVLPERERDRPTVEQTALEVSKRQQLQALLDQQIVVAPAVTADKVGTVNRKPVTQRVIAPPVSKTSTATVVAQKAVVTKPVAKASPAPTVIPEEPAPAPDVAVETQAGVNALLEWADNGRPQWAQNRFDVLLFDVSGLTLAVPLIALGQIQPIGDQLTPIFGQSEWFMGLLNSSVGQIKTVNTALFVMPEKYSPKFLETARYVISIDGLPWGLAVDGVNQPITLEPADVNWRSQRTSRPWLAGTVKSAMCALIDIPRMAALLTDSERRTRRR